MIDKLDVIKYTKPGIETEEIQLTTLSSISHIHANRETRPMEMWVNRSSYNIIQEQFDLQMKHFNTGPLIFGKLPPYKFDFTIGDYEIIGAWIAEMNCDEFDDSLYVFCGKGEYGMDFEGHIVIKIYYDCFNLV